MPKPRPPSALLAPALSVCSAADALALDEPMLEASELEAEASAAVPVVLSDILVAVIVIEPDSVPIKLVEPPVVAAAPAAVPVLEPVDEAVAEAVDAQVADVGRLSTPSPPQRF
ncbi:hypothetical protein KC345_g5426 [Hortaea werneckii]|nr:hypothetical protein KC345_g5426 [Hortaea werneckii]